LQGPNLAAAFLLQGFARLALLAGYFAGLWQAGLASVLMTVV
jgi:hypothetical protein